MRGESTSYSFDSGGCGADDAIAARDRHGHVTCIVYKACQRVCARAPKPSALFSPQRRAYTMAKKQYNKDRKENRHKKDFKRRSVQLHSVSQTVSALIPLVSDVVNLAWLAGVNGLLPVALMCCCMLGSDISKGFVSLSSRIHLLHRAYTHHIMHIPIALCIL